MRRESNGNVCASRSINDSQAKHPQGSSSVTQELQSKGVLLDQVTSSGIMRSTIVPYANNPQPEALSPEQVPSGSHDMIADESEGERDPMNGISVSRLMRAEHLMAEDPMTHGSITQGFLAKGDMAMDHGNQQTTGYKAQLPNDEQFYQAMSQVFVGAFRKPSFFYRAWTDGLTSLRYTTPRPKPLTALDYIRGRRDRSVRIRPA